MKNPLVSVCIPTRNGEKFLEEALLSIEDQSYRNIEVVISDDCSKDSTLSLCEKFRDRNKFNVKIYSHKPTGIGANWNNCLKFSNGSYIKFLFQDDILLPGCIEQMVSVLEEKDDIALVACQRNILIDGSGENWQKEWIYRYSNLQRNLKLPEFEFNVLDRRILGHPEFVKDPFNKIGEPTAVLFRRALLDAIGNFREDLHIILDLEFYYRVLKNHKIAILNKELVKFRLHNDQASKKEVRRHLNEQKIFKKLLFKDYFWAVNLIQKRNLLKDRYFNFT